MNLREFVSKLTTLERCYLSFLLVVVIASSVAVVYMPSAPSAPKAEQKSDMQIICATNESQFLKDEGWLQVGEASREQLSDNKRALMVYKPGTLVCTVWRNGKPEINSSQAGLWYWRPVT